MSAFEVNQFGQPVGRPLPPWSGVPVPPRKALGGRYVRVEPLRTLEHAAQLWEALGRERGAHLWTHLRYGPFDTEAAFVAWLLSREQSTDVLPYVIIDAKSGSVAGTASYQRVDPAHGSIELGGIVLGPTLQRTRAATEAVYLLIEQVFALGYRRCEWTSDTLNHASKEAAARFGFRFEGVFRQLRVARGRNRDIAWYSIIDGEWPARRDAFCSWLAPSNFDANGKQYVRLSDLMPREAHDEPAAAGMVDL